MPEPLGHEPVMLAEVLEHLRPHGGGIVVDGTLGAGGHAEAILERTTPDGRLFGFDRDPTYLEETKRRLARFGARVTVVCENYADAPAWLRDHGVTSIDAFLIDAGCSSMQLDDPERGISFSKDGPLDMRMDPRLPETAADLVAKLGVGDLERIFREFGEEAQARRIARKIVDVRKRAPIVRTRELAELVRATVGSGGRIHPATRVFQALRIAVNCELEALEKGVRGAIDCLAPGGRLVVLTFQSLEERVVKQVLRDAERQGRVRLIADAPVLPTDAEIARNPRARSAKLRSAERI